VLVRDLVGHPETAQVLATAAFREDGAAVPTEATHIDAWVTAVDGDTFTIRPAGATGAPRDVDVSHAVCTGNLVVPGEIVQPVVPCGLFTTMVRESGRGRVRSLLWIDQDGTVAQVSEVFGADGRGDASERIRLPEVRHDELDPVGARDRGGLEVGAGGADMTPPRTPSATR
jgi:hypothetical protein